MRILCILLKENKGTWYLFTQKFELQVAATQNSAVFLT